ncbi:AAA family ATPase [Thalassotalea psychrophila]|uniref:AAA family ATPase n=1 Tax=Thalassotalea psychrophila TaxID=3065647 RepID=A0ABY9TTP1_9GAMM|nr:AAA family ATPase [Colwelliaceae bacterium SQ149]
MSKVLIFGNSGSGKSTLAKKISAKNNVAHLDLDTIAWQPTSPPLRTPISAAEIQINNFIDINENWVVEGCYSDLLKLVMYKADEVIFLNLSVDDCIINAKNRSWEPHKYESQEAQDSNLEMLINWISQYPEREDHFSQQAHVKLFNTFSGKKEMHTINM